MIGALPDSSSDTLFVIGFPTQRSHPDVPATPAVLAFPSLEVQALPSVTMAAHVRAELPTDSAADVLVVVVGHDQEQRPLPHRAAIAALESALRSAGHTVVGRYWTPHTRPAATWLDYRYPDRIGTVLEYSSAVDFSHPVQIVADAPTPPWGHPFTEHGETLPAHLGRFARAVLPLIVRCDDRTDQMITQALVEASKGELPDDETGFALACALRDNTIYAPLLVPPIVLDLRRVEQLWMALYRGNADRRIRAKLATLIAASALRRRARLFAAFALAYAGDAPGAYTVGVLLHQQTSGRQLDQHLSLLADRVAAEHA
ncbi:DUF4192 family protein [Amycolatopsis sp. NPDC051371]|uniref:DUF4192 family protein n=1 Tax=Amycolatopsis sp. NPDC051371 TaxID=3155800 RepID=UPI00344597B6